MDFLKRLFGGKPTASSDDSGAHARMYYVKGKKCGAVTRLRVDMRNDLSRDDDDNFYVRKVVVDSKCYGQVEIELWFDPNQREINRAIQGGEFTTKEEWDREQAESAANSPAPTEP